MKHSIYKKIRKYVLFSSLGTAILVSLAAVINFFIVREEIEESSVDYAYAMFDSVGEVVVEQKVNELLQSTANAAVILDSFFETVSRNVTLMGENAEALITNPDNFLPQEVNFPDPRYEGIPVAQLSLDRLENYEQLSDEIGLLANLSTLLVSSYKSLDYIQSVYIGTQSGITISVDTDSNLKPVVFDPRERAWYRTAVDADELDWTNIYPDALGRGLVISCAKPVYNRDGSIYGVVGITTLVDEVISVLSNMVTSELGHSFIVNEYGAVIFSSDWGIAETWDTDQVDVKTLIPGDVSLSIYEDDGGIFDFADEDGGTWVAAYAAFETHPWVLVKKASIRETLSPIVTISGLLQESLSNFQANINQAIINSIIISVAIILLSSLVIVWLSHWLSKDLSKPIIELTKGAEIIGAGNLDFRLSIRTGNELESLSNSFNVMIDNVKSIASDKERMTMEFNVASDIYKSLLPAPSSICDDFKLYAAISSSDRLGGSFYDYFFIENNKLCVIIADVFGSGLPAALFMVVARTVIKNQMSAGKPVDLSMNIINTHLFESRSDTTSVAAFVGVLDVSTGSFSYVNAGQSKPIIRRSGGFYEELGEQAASRLAEVENIKFRSMELFLKQDDRLVLYSTGTGASDHTDLCGFLSSPDIKGLALWQTQEKITMGYKSFLDTKSEDMSLIVLEYSKGDKAQAEITVSPNTGAFHSEVQPFIKRQLGENEMGGSFYAGVAVTVEEIFMLAARHSKNADITVRCSITGKRVEIRIIYGGQEGNPMMSSKQNEKDVIEFTRKYAKEIRYDRLGKLNVLILVYVDDHGD
jgi:sigma-B regulation protein RsbU (phosphoserine phosphatase)